MGGQDKASDPEDVVIIEESSAEDVEVEIGTDAADEVANTLSIQKCVTLLQSRPDPITASLPAHQVESIINSYSAKQTGISPLADGFMLVSESEISASSKGQRAVPTKDSANSGASAGESAKLLQDTDVLGAGQTFMRLMKDAVPEIASLAYMPVGYTRHNIKQGDLRSGVSDDPDEDEDTHVITSDGYSGPASQPDEGAVRLPEPLLGSDVRSGKQVVILVPGGDNPQRYVLDGASVSCPLVDGTVTTTYDLLRPFPVDILRKLPRGIAFSEAETELAKVGRTLAEVYGSAEGTSVRYLLSRVPEDGSPDDGVQLNRLKKKGGNEDIVEEWVELGKEEAARLNKVKGAAADVDDYEPFSLTSILPKDGSFPEWRAAVQQRAKQASISNARDATVSLKKPNVSYQDIKVALVAEKHVPSTMSSFHSLHHLIPFYLQEDDADYGLIVDGADGVADPGGPAGPDSPEGPAQKLGAAGYVQSTLRTMMYVTGVRVADENVIAQAITEDYGSRVDRTTEMSRTIDALVSKGVPQNAAELAARDQVSLATMKSQRAPFLQAVAAEMVISCVTLSIKEGRPAVTDIRREDADAFSMSIHKGADKSLTRYVASVVDRHMFADNYRGGGMYGALDAHVHAIASKKLPPDFEKALGNLQNSWSKKTAASEKWQGFKPTSESLEKALKNNKTDGQKPADDDFLAVPATLANDSETAARSLTFQVPNAAVSFLKMNAPDPSGRRDCDDIDDPLKVASMARAGTFVTRCLDDGASAEVTSALIYTVRNTVPSFVALLRSRHLSPAHKAFLKSVRKSSDATDLLTSITHIRDTLKKVHRLRAPSYDTPSRVALACFLRDLHALENGKLQIVATFDVYAKEMARRTEYSDIVMAMTQGRTVEYEAIKVAASNIDSDLKGIYSELVETGILSVSDLVKNDGSGPDDDAADIGDTMDTEIEYELIANDSDLEDDREDL